MRWFRSHVRFGARLALFALTVQFVLSFTHVHLDDGPPVAASKLASLTGVAPASDNDIDSGAPSKPHPNSLADDHCAICTLIQMAGASPPPALPQLPLPVVVGGIVQVFTQGP